MSHSAIAEVFCVLSIVTRARDRETICMRSIKEFYFTFCIALHISIKPLLNVHTYFLLQSKWFFLYIWYLKCVLKRDINPSYKSYLQTTMFFSSHNVSWLSIICLIVIIWMLHKLWRKTPLCFNYVVLRHWNRCYISIRNLKLIWFLQVMFL